jgi:hypothetical protein
MDQLNPRQDSKRLMPPAERAPRRISPEQLAAVSRLQAYWMARVGLRAAAAASMKPDEVGSEHANATPR